MHNILLMDQNIAYSNKHVFLYKIFHEPNEKVMMMSKFANQYFINVAKGLFVSLPS